MAKPHSQWAWTKQARAFRRLCEADDAPCWVCGKPIDYAAPMGNRWSFTADHVHPIGAGGDLTPGLDDLRPAHRACNARRGKGRAVEVDPTSRRW